MIEHALLQNPGSARASRAGDGAPAIANFPVCNAELRKACFGEGAKTSTRGACAPQTLIRTTRGRIA
jgi:hypothetical protein